MTDDLKTKVTPLQMVFEEVNLSVFQKDWLESLTLKDEVHMPTLLLPIKKNFKKFDLPKLDDKEGYLQRFDTPGFRNTGQFWIFKMWIRENLGLEDYKKFHFYHRLSLIDKLEEEDKEYAKAKLIRSLLKERFSGDKSAAKDRLKIAPPVGQSGEGDSGQTESLHQLAQPVRAMAHAGASEGVLPSIVSILQNPVGLRSLFSHLGQPADLSGMLRGFVSSSAASSAAIAACAAS